MDQSIVEFRNMFDLHLHNISAELVCEESAMRIHTRGLAIGHCLAVRSSWIRIQLTSLVCQERTELAGDPTQLTGT